MSGNSFEPSMLETENNNASKSNLDSVSNNNNRLKNPRASKGSEKSEILNILNDNLNYFNQKKIEGKKFVLNTIRLPKALIKLNDKLPESQYESDYIKNRKNFRGLSFPNNILPVLKVRYNQNLEDDKKINDIKEYNNPINLHKISKSIELNPPTLLNNNKIYINKNNNKKAINDENMFLKNGKKNYIERANRFRGLNKFNTLKMKIDKDKPFNYRGQIDIIVEE